MNANTLSKRATFVASVALLTPSLGHALELAGKSLVIQPRIETGVMDYSLTQDAGSVTLLPTTSTAAANATGRKITLEATLPMLGGGVTFFADRLFLDLSTQQTATRSMSQSGDYTSSIFAGEPDLPTFVGGSNRLSLDADRSEYAISAGYAVTDQIALFAGYKWAKNKFKGSSAGEFESVFYGGYGETLTMGGLIRGQEDYTFEYDGPFVGLVYGLSVDRGMLRGRVSFNFAAALLDAEFKNASRYEWIGTRFNGVALDEPVAVDDTANEGLSGFTGETIGLTFGVSWNGSTSIEGLGYSLGVSGYNYNFDADNAASPGSTETALIYKVGISYAF